MADESLANEIERLIKFAKDNHNYSQDWEKGVRDAFHICGKRGQRREITDEVERAMEIDHALGRFGQIKAQAESGMRALECFKSAPKREARGEKPLAERGCVHCNPIKRRKILGDPMECVTVEFKP